MLVVIIGIMVVVPCALQCVQRMMNKTVSSIFFVHQNGGDVGKDESLTRKSHRYVCLAERFLNVESDEGIEMEASFDIEEKNC